MGIKGILKLIFANNSLKVFEKKTLLKRRQDHHVYLTGEFLAYYSGLRGRQEEIV